METILYMRAMTFSRTFVHLKYPPRRPPSAKPVIAPEGSYIPEPPEALEQLAFLWSTLEALEQLTFLRSPLEG